MSEKFVTVSKREYFLKVVPQSDEKTIQKVKSFLRQHFHTNDPINKSIKLAENANDSANLDQLYDYAIASNSSIVAFDSKDEIIAVLLNCPAEKDDKGGYEPKCESSPDYLKYFEIIDGFFGSVNMFEKYGENRCLEQIAVAVSPSWQNEGVCKALINRSKKLAKELNCGLSHSFCTGLYCDKAFESCGYEEVARKAIADVKKENGEPVFPVEAPHKHVTFRVLKHT